MSRFVVTFGLAICRRNVPWPLGASRRTADAELTNVRLYGELDSVGSLSSSRRGAGRSR